MPYETFARRRISKSRSGVVKNQSMYRHCTSEEALDALILFFLFKSRVHELVSHKTGCDTYIEDGA